MNVLMVSLNHIEGMGLNPYLYSLQKIQYLYPHVLDHYLYGSKLTSVGAGGVRSQKKEMDMGLNVNVNTDNMSMWIRI